MIQSLEQVGTPGREENVSEPDAGTAVPRPFDLDILASYCERGLAHRRQGDFDQAILEFTKAIRLNPAFDDAYNNRGNYFARGDYDRAIADYDAALRLRPGLAVAYMNRGLAFARKGRFDEAIADSGEAIRLHPGLAGAHFVRGAADSRQGNYDEAIRDLTEAIRLDPKDALAHNDRGLAHAGKGEYDRAIADYDEALRLKGPENLVHYNRARAHQLQGDQAQAVDEFTLVLQRDPDSSAAYYHRGAVYLALGDYDAAATDFTEALWLEPGNAAALAQREEAFRLLGGGSPPADRDEMSEEVQSAHPVIPATSYPVMPAPSHPVIPPSRHPVTERSPGRRAHVSPWGVFPLLFGSLALLCASVPYLGILTLPLGGLGVLAAAWGIVRSWPSREHLGVRMVGTAVSILVLVCAWFWPGVLSQAAPTTASAVKAKGPDRFKIPIGWSRTIPTNGEPVALEEDEWVDVSKFFLHHQGVRLFVTSVSIQPGKAGSRDLLVRLQVYNRGTGRSIVYESWGAGGAEGLKHPPRLSDNRGVSYPVHPVKPGKEEAGQVRRAPMPVMEKVQDLLLFDAPAKQVEFLRLELPAAAFGCSGQVRLQIPWTLVRHE